MSNAVSRNFARSLAEEGVTVAEWAFLRMLYDVDAMAPSTLAEALGMTKGAISKLSDKLLGKRLIQRSDDRDDKRAHRLSLTESGRIKVPVLAAVADRNDTEHFGALTPEDLDVLNHILNTLAKTLNLSKIPVD